SLEAPLHFQRKLPFFGLGLPLFSEKGQRGVILFTGERPLTAGELLPDIHYRCLGHFATMAGMRPGSAAQSPCVSKREMECLKLTANGHTSEEIARLLGLSVHTANQYLTQSAQKLNAVNRTQAVAKALRLGLID